MHIYDKYFLYSKRHEIRKNKKTRTIRTNSFNFFLCLFFSFYSISTVADSKIIPSDVYQKTEELRLKLIDLNILDMQMYESVEADNALRHPRHVMQKVRKCHQVFEKILKDRDIQIDPLPRMHSEREIRPSDVLGGVNHLIKEISKIQSKASTPKTEYVSGKLPSDVFNNLKKICRAAHVEITPPDVYRPAKVVNENMKIIFSNQLSKRSQPSPQQFTGKIPADVYKEAELFLNDLRILALNPDYSIPGGVVIPNTLKDKTPEPQDVMNLMNDALAETKAMKYTLHIHNVTELPPLDTTKTPSDVFGQIHEARLIVQELIEHEAMLDKE